MTRRLLPTLCLLLLAACSGGPSGAIGGGDAPGEAAYINTPTHPTGVSSPNTDIDRGEAADNENPFEEIARKRNISNPPDTIRANPGLPTPPESSLPESEIKSKFAPHLIHPEAQ